MRGRSIQNESTLKMILNGHHRQKPENQVKDQGQRPEAHRAGLPIAIGTTQPDEKSHAIKVCFPSKAIIATGVHRVGIFLSQE
ncbi:hypothetical protein [Pseudomonas sp.]|uniref:hypothetical protein n=1 Tax=Pseudomonas sp. TaxID=306 RepID=UPI003FD6F6DA